MADMRLVTTGVVGAERAGELHRVRGRQPALVFAYLVLERRVVLREELAGLLWPHDLPPHWPGAVRGLIAKLRAFAIEADLPLGLEATSRGTIALRLDPTVAVDVDVESAAADVEAAESALASGDHEAAVHAAARAAEVAGTVFLPSEDGPWVHQQRTRLAALLRRARLVAIAAARAGGDHDRAVATAAQMLEEDPFDEQAAREAMAVHLAVGRRRAALDVYERLRVRLDDDLGVRPSAQTEALWLTTLGGAPSPRRGPSSTPRTPVDRTTPFVGRRTALSVLDDALARAVDGQLQVVAVEGEAGIGKTRLLAEWVEKLDFATVLWGRCSGARLAFEPITAALSTRLTHDADALERLGPVAETLAPLFPELLGGISAPATDPAHARSRLFRALASAISDAGRSDAVVLVIDDAQELDSDTADLIRFLSAALADAPVLIAMTVKEPFDHVVELLGELQRRGLTPVALSGLGEGEVTELLAASGVDPAEARTIAQSLRRGTGGNPLYVHQLVAEARIAGRPVDPSLVPAALRALLERRLATFGREVVDTAGWAAVAGDTIDAGVVSAASGRDLLVTCDVLAELCRRGLLVESGVETFEWAHGLVRDAVLASIPATRSATMNRAVAVALQASAAPTVVAADFRRAGRAGVDGAVRHGLRAGALALEQSAWGAAAVEFETVASIATVPDDLAAALVGLGVAERGRRLVRQARAHLERALAVADESGLRRRSAEAILALVGGGGRGVGVDLEDAERARLLRRALTHLRDGDDDDLAVPVLCELALSLMLTPRAADERVSAVDEAVRRARHSGNRQLLAVALVGRRTVLVDATTAERRLADADEVLAIDERDVRPETRLAAAVGRVEDLLLLGRRVEFDDAVTHTLAAARRFDHPYWLWAATSWNVLAQIVAGRTDDAEALAFEAFAHQSENPEAIAALGVELVDIRLFQGRPSEMLDLLESAANDNPQIPAYRAVLALCAAEAADGDRARTAFDHFAADGFSSLPQDSNRFLTLAVLADACASLGAREHAARLTDLLQPYAPLHVVHNCYGGGGAYWGPTTLQLARLSRLVDDERAAIAYADDALRAAERLDAPLVAQRVRTLFPSRSATEVSTTAIGEID